MGLHFYTEFRHQCFSRPEIVQIVIIVDEIVVAPLDELDESLFLSLGDVARELAHLIIDDKDEISLDRKVFFIDELEHRIQVASSSDHSNGMFSCAFPQDLHILFYELSAQQDLQVVEIFEI